jgi:hypothetical protein
MAISPRGDPDKKATSMPDARRLVIPEAAKRFELKPALNY